MASSPARTGSVLKVLTASAAIAVLGADFQIPTRTFTGSTAGTIVLVGYGDPTLSAMPAGTESVYTGAPKLSTLAASTLATYASTNPGQEITQVVLDASYWNPSDKWDASWKRSEQTIGYHSEVTALQVDGDRADPTKQTSPRGTDPIRRAGNLFLNALKAADNGDIVANNVAITTGISAGGTQLGRGEVAAPAGAHQADAAQQRQHARRDARAHRLEGVRPRRHRRVAAAGDPERALAGRPDDRDPCRHQGRVGTQRSQRRARHR